MNVLSLSFAYLRHKALSTFLNIVIFASGIALIVALLLINTQLNDEFSKNLKGIDLVVGAKGSPMQLILSSVFHLDIPTGNIPLADAENLEKQPMVKSFVPLALGDNYNGFRIVGTNADYIRIYDGEFAAGGIFNAPMQVVLGADVAKKYHNKIGDKIIGAHGLVNSDDLHTDFPYIVVGILKPTNTVLDRLVLTEVESVWKVHERPDPDNPQEIEYKKTHKGRELTALLISYKSPLAAAFMPREINKSGTMQAASPSYEVARLNSFLGFGADALQYFGYYLTGLAGLGVFVALYNAMDERRYDLALMRSFGARPKKLFALIICESLIIALCGALCGIILGHILVGIAAIILAATKNIHINGAIFVPQEIYLLLASIIIGIMAALIPAIRVYRLDIFNTLVR